jgi:hypothetical protein
MLKSKTHDSCSIAHAVQPSELLRLALKTTPTAAALIANVYVGEISHMEILTHKQTYRPPHNVESSTR